MACRSGDDLHAPSRRSGEGRNPGLPCLVLQSKAFHPPSECESLFSRLPERKVTKREGHPTWRLPGMNARQVREPGPGFSTAHPVLAKRSRRPCRLPLRGLSTPTHRLHRGGWIKSNGNGKKAPFPLSSFRRRPEELFNSEAGHRTGFAAEKRFRPSPE